MKESSLVKRILRELREAADVKCVKVPGGPMGLEAGTPDIIGCKRGRMFAIEAKVGKNTPTELQELRLSQWKLAGAATAVAREDFDVGAFLASMQTQAI